MKQAWEEAFRDKPYTTHALAFAGAPRPPHTSPQMPLNNRQPSQGPYLFSMVTSMDIPVHQD